MNHLLHLAIDSRAQQSAKLAHAMVLMDDVVAHLNLVQLLERERQLARPRTVTLEVVLVESVKYLVVGEYAQSQVVVNKALVQRAQAGFKLDVIVSVVEDGTQSRNLLFVVAEDEDAIATRKKILERVTNEVEVLVINALRRAVQRHACLALKRALAIAKVNAAHRVEHSDKMADVDHLVHCALIAFLGNHRAGRHALIGNLAHTVLEPLGVAAHEHCLGLDVVEQRSTRGIFAAIVADNADVLDTLLAELRLDVEGAYRVNLVAEEVNAIGQLVAVTVDVENGASQRELSRLIDIVDLRKPQFAQPLGGLGLVDGRPHR